MAKIYYNRVVAGAWALEDVPEPWRAEVEALLERDGGASAG